MEYENLETYKPETKPKKKKNIIKKIKLILENKIEQIFDSIGSKTSSFLSGRSSKRKFTENKKLENNLLSIFTVNVTNKITVPVQNNDFSYSIYILLNGLLPCLTLTSLNKIDNDIIRTAISIITIVIFYFNLLFEIPLHYSNKNKSLMFKSIKSTSSIINHAILFFLGLYLINFKLVISIIFSTEYILLNDVYSSFKFFSFSQIPIYLYYYHYQICGILLLFYILLFLYFMEPKYYKTNFNLFCYNSLVSVFLSISLYSLIVNSKNSNLYMFHYMLRLFSTIRTITNAPVFATVHEEYISYFFSTLKIRISHTSNKYNGKLIAWYLYFVLFFGFLFFDKDYFTSNKKLSTTFQILNVLSVIFVYLLTFIITSILYLYYYYSFTKEHKVNKKENLESLTSSDDDFQEKIISYLDDAIEKDESEKEFSVNFFVFMTNTSFNLFWTKSK